MNVKSVSLITLSWKGYNLMMSFQPMVVPPVPWAPAYGDYASSEFRVDWWGKSLSERSFECLKVYSVWFLFSSSCVQLCQHFSTVSEYTVMLTLCKAFVYKG